MSTVLFINGTLGLSVLDFVSNLDECKLSAIVLNSDSKRGFNYFDEVQSLLRAKGLDLPILKWTREVSQSPELELLLKDAKYGVSALFGHILPLEIIEKFSIGILNLHPSFLPIGRGADPIPWGIIEKQVQGITLHLIDKGLDTGDIVFQKEILSDINMTAGEIYENAISELYSEFSRLFIRWINGEIELKPQPKNHNSLHRSSELDLIKIIKDDEVATFGDFVRRIQATTFSNGRVPKYVDSEGKIWDIIFKIAESGKTNR